MSTKKILVIGDVMLDRSLTGPVHRLAPEAPIPIVDNPIETLSPGGAANVAANIVALGYPNVHVCGLAGCDEYANKLNSIISAHGPKPHIFCNIPTTTVKTRIFTDRHILARVDTEVKATNEQSRTFINQILHLLEDTIVLVISDYGKGVFHYDTLRLLIYNAHKAGIIIIVDPKSTDFTRYYDADIITPNVQEAYQALNLTHILHPTDEEVESLLIDLYQKNEDSPRGFIDNILLTRGKDGMTWYEGYGCEHIPAKQQQSVFDVTGAGDTVVAALAVAKADNMSIKNMLEFASYAAGLAVSKVGTTIVSREEVDKLIDTNYDIQQISKL